MNKKYVILMGMMVSSIAFGELLMEVDFAGSGAVGTIASTDGQISLNSAVTFTSPASAVTAVGGSLSTAGWNYDGTGDAAANNDLFTSSNFGSPTRMDIDLGLATAGFSYTITNVEIVVRASNQVGTNWEVGYRDTSSANQILAGGAITVQAGSADPWATYSIDLSGEGLTATDSAISWLAANKLRVMFYEPTGTNADNLQIDAIRFNGTVVPEPATLGMIVFFSASLLVIRRRFMI